MSPEHPYAEQNRRQRERLRALVERLSEDELRSSVNEETDPSDGPASFGIGLSMVLTSPTSLVPAPAR